MDEEEEEEAILNSGSMSVIASLSSVPSIGQIAEINPIWPPPSSTLNIFV